MRKLIIKKATEVTLLFSLVFLLPALVFSWTFSAGGNSGGVLWGVICISIIILTTLINIYIYNYKIRKTQNNSLLIN